MPPEKNVISMSAFWANMLLVLVTMAWGLSYVVIKIGGQTMPPFELIAIRFTIASVLCCLLFYRHLQGVNRRAVLYGAILGLTMFIGSTTMVYGVQTTDASTATFLASAKIVFVPLLMAIWLWRFPARRIVLGTLGTTIGIALLSLENGLHLSLGAILCILSALAYALHIIFTGAMVQKEDAIAVGVLQQVTMAILGWLCAFLFNDPIMPQGTTAWAAVLTLALVNGVFVFVAQPIAQRFASSENTALIFAMEPVFGAVFSFMLMGDWLTRQDALGALFVLASVLAASVQKKPHQ